MSKEPKRFSYEEFARDPARVLDAVAQDGEPVLVERLGRLYRLAITEEDEVRDIWAGYDAEKVRAALRESAGALQGVDTEELLRDIHLQRQQDSQGRHD